MGWFRKHNFAGSSWLPINYIFSNIFCFAAFTTTQAPLIEHQVNISPGYNLRCRGLRPSDEVNAYPLATSR